jgi:hypothetical protein
LQVRGVNRSAEKHRASGQVGLDIPEIWPIEQVKCLGAELES